MTTHFGSLRENSLSGGGRGASTCGARGRRVVFAVYNCTSRRPLSGGQARAPARTALANDCARLVALVCDRRARRPLRGSVASTVLGARTPAPEDPETCVWCWLLLFRWHFT